MKALKAAGRRGDLPGYCTIGARLMVDFTNEPPGMARPWDHAFAWTLDLGNLP